MPTGGTGTMVTVLMCTGTAEALPYGLEQQPEQKNGFVMDFGELGAVKAWLEQHFDHTLLLDTDDPLLPKFRELEEAGACRLIVFDDVGMEGTCEFVANWVDEWLEQFGGRVWLHSVEVRENNKNSARITREP